MSVGSFFKRLFSRAAQGEANPYVNTYLAPADATSYGANLQLSRGALRSGGVGTGAKWDLGYRLTARRRCSTTTF